MVLLGAQRFDETLASLVRGLDCGGPIALVTAGWREREDEDEALRKHLACETINLRLYQRAAEVFAADRELAQAHRAKQTKLRHKQDFYRIRLSHELAANHVIRQRHAPAEVLTEEEAASLDAIRSLDAHHLGQCRQVHAQFEDACKPSERASVAGHREQIAKLLGRCRGLAIAGGHVASMLNRMRLFGIDQLITDQAVFAWSGGAMIISERVVLFHDSPPQGRGASEILDEGLGLVRGMVVLPQPETRLRLDDPERVGVLARRFEPARCLAFPAGAHVTVHEGRITRASAVTRLQADGGCEPFAVEP